ncbi:MAG: hypothetical protein A3J79_04345 [Elusimicrobia bacterium RIFOXYB2_FULL_62_6]|nr:MAG: hypothetical protein A3J79_04345 [Elusimicrobia bacterium RIFOXYB2_FULL_62_6]
MISSLIISAPAAAASRDSVDLPAPDLPRKRYALPFFTSPAECSIMPPARSSARLQKARRKESKLWGAGRQVRRPAPVPASKTQSKSPLLSLTAFSSAETAGR